jgi:hypothetical protein
MANLGATASPVAFRKHPARGSSWRSSKGRRSQREEPDDDNAQFDSKRTYLEQNDHYPPPLGMIAIRPKRSASSYG